MRGGSEQRVDHRVAQRRLRAVPARTPGSDYAGLPSHEPTGSHRRASSTAPSCPVRRGSWPPRRDSEAGSRPERPPEAGRQEVVVAPQAGDSGAAPGGDGGGVGAAAAATAARPGDPHNDGGQRHYTPPPCRGSEPLVVGGCVSPPAHQIARDSANPAVVEQLLLFQSSPLVLFHYGIDRLIASLGCCSRTVVAIKATATRQNRFSKSRPNRKFRGFFIFLYASQQIQLFRVPMRYVGLVPAGPHPTRSEDLSTFVDTSRVSGLTATPWQ